MKIRVWLLMMLVCLAVLFQAGSLWAALYKYQDLKMGFPNDPGNHVSGFNDSSQIVGYYYIGAPNGGTQGYFCDLGKGIFTWLQPIGGDYTNSYVYGINKLGQIVGSCSTSQNSVFAACVWTDPGKAPTLLSQLPNYTSGYAYGINDNGLIVGYSYNNEGSQHACMWTMTAPIHPVDLGTLGGSTSAASGVNNAGQIVGWAINAQGNKRACLWNPNQSAQDLATALPNTCTAQFINNQGNVVGQNPVTGAGMGNAFFWNHQTGGVQYISAGYDSWADGLSDANQVIARGETAIFGNPPVFSWTPAGGTKDLNKLVVNLPQGVTVALVNLVSPKGNILGCGSQGNSCLLTPVVTSTANNLLLLK